MDFFKKNSFIITIIFTVILSMFIGKITIQIILNKVIPYNEVKIDVVQKTTVSTVKSQKTAEKIIKKNIFNSALSFDEKKEVQNVNVTQNNSEQNGNNQPANECKESNIAVTIVATIPAEPVEFSYLGIMDKATNDVKYYSVGDEFVESGVFVFDVMRSVIILDRNGVKECIYAGREKEEKKAPVIVDNNVAAGSSSNVDVKQTGANSYEVSSEDLERELKNLNKLSRDARIIPAFDKDSPDKSIGFKVFAIKSGTLFEKIGLKNGDIIQSINGMPIDSPDKALEIYSKLIEGTSNVKVDLTRHGQKQSLDYSIK